MLLHHLLGQMVVQMQRIDKEKRRSRLRPCQPRLKASHAVQHLQGINTLLYTKTTILTPAASGVYRDHL